MTAGSPQSGERPADAPTFELSRRSLLGGALSLPAVALLAGSPGVARAIAGGETRSRSMAYATATAPPPGGGFATWESVRDLFELDPSLRHLSAYILAPHSRPVREAITRYGRGLDRDPRGYSGLNGRYENEAAAAAGLYLNTDPDLIALTDSTTMGLGVFLGGMRIGGGDEILMTTHEHYSALTSVRLAAARTGAGVRQIQLYPSRSPQQATVNGIVSAIERAINARTRAVVVTWVHSSSGVRLPLKEIAQAVARRNIGRSAGQRVMLVVDGAHGFGTGPVDIEENCDAMIAGCHKWLAGPRGTGLIWASPEAWARVAPIIPSFRSWGDGTPGEEGSPGGYHSFEHRWALGDAFRLQQQIGPDRIEARIGELAAQLRDGLQSLPGVTLHVPADPKLHSGLVCLTVNGVSADTAVQRMYADHRVLASVSPYAVRLVRLGTSWINTPAEVDAAIAAVASVVP